MDPTSPAFRLSVWVPATTAEAAFDRLVHELRMVLPREGRQLLPGPSGRIVERAEDGTERAVATVVAWEPPRRISLRGSPADWDPKAGPVDVTLRIEPEAGNVRIVVEAGSWDPAGTLTDPAERIGWIASELIVPMLRGTSASGFGDWWTDRRARRPTGPVARAAYSDPTYHRPNFRAILEHLALSPKDRLLEVGCGGGAFLREALATGCRAWAVDHSPEMVEVAREQNARAVADGRVTVLEGDAHRLPLPDALCTCALATGVLGFLDRPLVVLREVRRVLRPGGRLVLFTGSRELRGTPAAPEPIASRVHFYTDDELVALGRSAGFDDVRVERPPMGRYAREAGLPDPAVAFFDQGPPAGQLLLARVPASVGSGSVDG